MKWEDVPSEVREQMKFIGDFAPTVNVADKAMKGYRVDDNGDGGKTYISHNDLRAVGLACFYMAAWLETRAAMVTAEYGQ